MKRFHLAGIGGIGMCGLAQILVHEGISVTGSDRREDVELFGKLQRLGIVIYPQDGSGVEKGVSKVIISRAIEDDNPEVIKAKKLDIPIFYRQDELKGIFRKYGGIAVAGTSGKTTVVGMIGCIFDVAGQDITVVNGGIMKNYVTKKDIGNVHIGRLPYFCVETDESEGDLRGYHPEIGVITNIGSDHMSFRKLKKVYEDFAAEVRDKLILSGDIVAEAIELYPSYSIFRVDGKRIRLNVPGLHNIYNALSAIGVAYAWGISPNHIVKGLGRFKGIKRRFEILRGKDGIRIIDDYAHNPDKIRAALETAGLGKGRVIAVYQPHGYKPTKMFLDELAEVFSGNLNEKDYLFIPRIYYAGGKVKMDISSRDLVKKIKSTNVEYIPERDDIKTKIQKIFKSGDTVLVMGARDTTLSTWAKGLLC